MPVDTGLAFVLVQHLDPNHENVLTELLSRATVMPVHEVADSMRIEPNHFYANPPNTNKSVLRARLSLVPRMQARGQHMPIGFFLRSLADDQRNRAIGVILSGTASDGTEGLRAIKAEGGLDEKSARYGGEPHSAIATGVVEIVLPPDGIALELARIGRHPNFGPITGCEIGRVPSRTRKNGTKPRRPTIAGAKRGSLRMDRSRVCALRISRWQIRFFWSIISCKPYPANRKLRTRAAEETRLWRFGAKCA
jgi:hypothetical protein